MTKTLKKYIFTAFGFPVLLHNVVIKESKSGDEYADINIKDLEKFVVKALIKSSIALTGAKLKFIRKFLKLSLRDLGHELEIPHTNIKLWEDNINDKTGLNPTQEARLKYLVFLYIHTLEQKELSKTLFSMDLEFDVNNGPLEIKDLKFGT
jgi:DNA-binding transcriptional regulator YiaG